MLQNSNLIDGQQAKTLNEACKRYLQLQQQIKELQEQQAEALATIKDICENGTNETTKVVVKMADVKPTLVFDSNLFKTSMPDLYAKYKTKEKAGYRQLKDIQVKL